MKKLAQGFNTAAQDSNPGSRSRESEALHVSHCALIALYQCNAIKEFENIFMINTNPSRRVASSISSK